MDQDLLLTGVCFTITFLSIHKTHLPSLSLFQKETERKRKKENELAGNKATVRVGLGSPIAVLVDSTNLTGPFGWHSFPSDLQSLISSVQAAPDRAMQYSLCCPAAAPCPAPAGALGRACCSQQPSQATPPLQLPNPLVFPPPCLYWIKINSKWKHLHGKLNYVWMELKLLPWRMFCATRETFLPTWTFGHSQSWSFLESFWYLLMPWEPEPCLTGS